MEQCARYPLAQVQDLLKGLHQSVFGCGHFVADEAAAKARLDLELASPGERSDVEWLDGEFCRVHLGFLAKTGLSWETLLRLFLLSAEHTPTHTAALEQRLTVLRELAAAGSLPFSGESVEREIAAWRKAGFPACHHSPEFRAAYHPAYRVIRKVFLWCLPLLCAIDRVLAMKGRALVALEGGSASGKTTLAAFLERIYGCTVFHMDDFFLRPEQRTAQRLAEPGGNVDRERFYEEVLRPLTEGKPVRYQRFDCHTQSLQEPFVVTPKALTIVEGAYSMHPLLADHYDLSAFLRIAPPLQRTRIQKRNTPEMAERFFTTWIPLEHFYFEKTKTAERCTLVLEVEQL